MAFGLGFNKAKVLSSAEKHVQQGKLQNAITEYEKVLKNDPKDLTVLNTVGDLYARLGQTDEASSCFKNVGDAYAQQGFTVKAIAMYKKLTKLRSSLEGTLKLAELYTQQGLFNDARQQYLQVADEFLRSGEFEQAVRIFQKTLEMDPENVAMKVRLAEVYIKLNKKKEAWQIFSDAADQLRSRGQLGPAEDVLQRMLTLDPKNPSALLLRGRNALEAGDNAAAIHYLQQVPDIDSQPEGLKALLRAYIATERLSDAGVLATKLLTIHNDLSGVSDFVEALMKGGLYQDALNVYHQFTEPLMAADRGKILENLHTIIGHVRTDPSSLELLLDLFQRSGDNTHISEVTELLAHASVQTGNLEKARSLYQQLMTVEPQNPIHQQNLQQVSVKLGDGPHSELITAQEGALLVDELEATAPSLQQSYPENIGNEVRAALTDAELFVSYNMPAKALGPLVAALPQAPEDLRLNQRLAALHTRAGRFAEAALCCRTLEKVYSEAGYEEEAGRYGDLAGRCEQRAGTAPARAVAEAAVSPASVAPPAPWPTEPAEFEVSSAEQHSLGVAEEVEEEAQLEPVASAEDEIDLSGEWEGTSSHESTVPQSESAPAEEEAEAVAEHSSPTPANDELVSETVEEIRFYLQHRMRLQALAAMAKLEALSNDPDLIGTLRGDYDSAFAPAPISPAEPVSDSAPEDAAEKVSIEEEPTHELPAETIAAEPAHSDSELNQLVADLESSLGDGLDQPAGPSEPEPAAEEVVATANERPGDVLGELVNDLESSLGDDFLPTQPTSKAQPQPVPVRSRPVVAAPAASASPASATLAAAVAPAAMREEEPVHATAMAASAIASPAAVASAPSAGIGDTSLSQMFEEMKGELEEDTATRSADEDPETHYNLGVAFREMGLLDEAIGELQKVCQIVDRGHPFPNLMQTYTWLAQCFLDKGVPQAAIRWYERALRINSIDEDTRTALHYELAGAYESAQNRDAALSHFLEVYGSNIDYRDVAERIKILKS